jgi:hypothetical protein
MSAPRGGVPGAQGAVSRGDHAVILGLLLLLTLAASLTPIRSFDYWWQIKTGEWILTQRSIPRSDPYSFTAAGAPWIDHEWLFQVLTYLGHAVLGPEALVCLKACGLLALCLLMALHMKNEGHGPAGIAVILLPAFLGASFRLDVRPEIATLLLLPCVVHLVLIGRDTGRRGPLLFVPPIVAFWANLHVGVILVPAVLGIGAALTWITERSAWFRRGSPTSTNPNEPFARRLAVLALATALAIGLNPYGFRIYLVPFGLSRLLGTLPSPNLEWARPELADFPLFWIAVVVAVGITLAGFRRLDPVATPALLLAAALAAMHLRNIGLFFLLLPYGVARPCRALVDAVQRTGTYRFGTVGGKVRPGFVLAALVVVAGIPLLVWLPPGIVWGIGIASDNEPAGAVDFLATERVGDRMFNDVRFGGYLIWRRFPERRVFIDGRNEVYPQLLREVFAALEDAAAWQALLDRHRIDAAFLRYPPSLQKVTYAAEGGGSPRTGERSFSAAYFPKERWALVYWDDDAMIFLRRSADYEDVIARLEYRALHPDDWRYLYAGVLTGHLPAGPILEEIGRKLGEDPTCRRARELLRHFTGLAEAIHESRPGSPSAGG